MGTKRKKDNIAVRLNTPKHDLWIISGPSSVGKSTFIESCKSSEITGLPSDSPTIFPEDINTEDFVLDLPHFVHYNILRPCHFMHQFKLHNIPKSNSSFSSKILKLFYRKFSKRVQRSIWNDIKQAWNYKIDSKWMDITNICVQKKAIILAVNRDTLLNRVRDRMNIEKEHLSRRQHNVYPSEYWLSVYSKINLLDIYIMWCKELDDRDIDYVLLNGSNDSYAIIESTRCLSYILK